MPSNTIDIMGDDVVFRKVIDRTIESICDDNCTFIGNYAFASCRALATASFPNVTSIGSSAFANCTSLTTVSFPSVISIGGNAFQNCIALTTVILNASRVAICETSIFNNAPNAITYVPDSLVTSYQVANNWSQYASRIKGISELPN